jgi:hypothetical protein
VGFYVRACELHWEGKGRGGWTRDVHGPGRNATQRNAMHRAVSTSETAAAKRKLGRAWMWMWAWCARKLHSTAQRGVEDRRSYKCVEDWRGFSR